MGEEHGGALGKERVEKRLQELMESGVQDKWVDQCCIYMYTLIVYVYIHTHSIDTLLKHMRQPSRCTHVSIPLLKQYSLTPLFRKWNYNRV
jgi:hypothetical protein